MLDIRCASKSCWVNFPKCISLITSFDVSWWLCCFFDFWTSTHVHLFIYSFIHRAVHCGAHGGVQEPLARPVSQRERIWHLICDLITNKTCQRFRVFLTGAAPPSDSAVISLNFTANSQLTILLRAALRFSRSLTPGRWSACYVCSIWTVDCNICMNYLTSRFAWKTVFAFFFARDNLLHYNSSWQSK